MRFNRVRAILAAGIMALAGTTTAAVLAAGPASASSSQVVVVNCSQGQVRPATYDIGCMPSQEFLAQLRWTSWRSVAFGGGVLKVNNCTPTCARGRYIKYPVLTVLWRARPWPRHAGRQYFSRLTLIFTGKRPGRVPVTQTITLPA
jgi:hypothetical protein